MKGMLVGLYRRHALFAGLRPNQQLLVSMALDAELIDLLGGAGGLVPQSVGHMSIGLDDAALRVTVGTALQGFPVSNSLFGDSGVHWILMTKFAVGLGLL